MYSPFHHRRVESTRLTSPLRWARQQTRADFPSQETVQRKQEHKDGRARADEQPADVESSTEKEVQSPAAYVAHHRTKDGREHTFQDDRGEACEQAEER